MTIVYEFCEKKKPTFIIGWKTCYDCYREKSNLYSVKKKKSEWNSDEYKLLCYYCLRDYVYDTCGFHKAFVNFEKIINIFHTNL